ncbi:MAG TPA: A24 family peptidase [Rhizomicrobium sp.]|nr:A24 family peptidase [Rhizomicrobium sp.]
MALAAPFIGSFLGTLAIRLPEGQPVLFGRSACPSCGKTLGARELIPFASWLLQRGRCRGCGARISYFYPAMELGALAVVLWAASQTTGAIFFISCGLGWLLLALAAMDARTMRLDDRLVALVAAGGLATTWFFMRGELVAHLIGGAAGFALLAGISLAYRHLRKRDGLGLGDAKLFGAAGLWLGWPSLVSVLLLASMSGLAFVLVAAALGQRFGRTSALPFGPFIALGFWIVWLHGPLEPQWFS